MRSAERLRQIAGAGVEGDVDGIHYRLGRGEFALAGGASEFVAQTDALILADESGEIARFAVGEQPRAGGAGLIRGLMAQGIACEILSGDCQTRVDAVADCLGIGDRLANASPADKLARLDALRKAGHVVAMVGDGINDAPVLAGADVAIAIGNGSAMAHAASGILLASSQIDTLLEARRIAGEMLVRLKQNLAWALAYNLAVVPVAAFGWVPPWLAAIGMSASSIVVILNSLRIGRRPSDLASAASPAVDSPTREATA